MHLMFLRGKVDCRTQKVKHLNEHHDMWTQLANAMLRKGDVGEMLYWGGERFQEYTWHFRERWVKNFKTCKVAYPMDKRDGYHDFEPDVIMCRGGFKEYHYILKRCPDAFKIYYGAGKRWLPQDGFSDYQLILVDSEEQKRKAQKKCPKIPVEIIIKPAADNIFYPRNVEKKYDVCFVAAIPEDERKRVEWIYKTCSKNLKVLQLGQYPKKYKVPSNFKIKHISRDKMPHYISQCKVGIIPYTKDDSGPRVISEFMACGIPVRCKGDVRHSYNLPKDMENMNVREFYLKNYSLPLMAKRLRKIIDEHRR